LRTRPAQARELEAWWQDLAGDAPWAHRAIWSLAGVPAQAVPLLRDRLRPAGNRFDYRDQQPVHQPTLDVDQVADRYPGCYRQLIHTQHSVAAPKLDQFAKHERAKAAGLAGRDLGSLGKT
jgi:hypothetical protein